MSVYSGKLNQKILPFYGKPATAVMSSDKKWPQPNEEAEVAKSSAWLTTPRTTLDLNFK